MNKKVEPISIEKVDNPDGSYIKKYIYDAPPEKAFEYLSKIEVYNSENIVQKSEYFEDNHFSCLGGTETREYNPDGSYVKKLIWAKPNKNGWLSEIVNYDKDDKYLGYTDNNFAELGETETREYNPDGSYVEKVIWAKPDEDGWLSGIANYTSNDAILNSVSYRDNNFENIYRKNIFKHFKAGSYICLREYEKPANKIYSEIIKFDNNNNILYTKQYKFKGIFAKILFRLAR